MEWSVVKIGVEQFDILHAYGLGMLMATATGEPVVLWDAGCLYQLSCPVPRIPRVSCSVLLECVLPLPREEDVLDCDPRAEEPKLAVAVLDGLLAALFTTPGARILSVSDLLGRQRLDGKALQLGLLKVTKRISKWRALARGAARETEDNWLADVLRDYDPAHPTSPTLVEGKAERDINVYIPIDPAFGYSLRSARSHGRMTEKTQVALRGTRYGALLAFAGAARFLRGQRLGGALLNCYVPLARKLTISAQSALPLLLPVDERPDQAAVRRWLALSKEASRTGAAWSGLAYQTLLTQGQQQSLSIESGLLECNWIVSLQERLGLMTFWHALLAPGGAAIDEQEPLLDCLKRRDASAWVTHLHARFQRLQGRSEGEGRRYHLEEVRRITEIMNDSERLPLRQVLEREQGTRCFGRALRQIGRSNPARLRDLLEDLEEARTHTQLLPVLHRIVAASEIEKAKKKRLITVPTENDLAALLEDIEQFGIPVLIGLLQVLSSLHYPHSDNAQKYELSTLIRVLLALAVHLGALEIDKGGPSPSSHELFLDDSGISGDFPEEDEEL